MHPLKTMALGAGIIAIGALVMTGGLYAWRIFVQAPAVPAIIVTSPTSTDAWTIGSVHTITWTETNIPPSNKISVALRRIPPPPLQTEGQEFDPLLFVNVTNTTSIDWTIADAYPTGTYVLTVASYAGVPVTSTISGESAPFTLSHEPLIGGQKDAHGCLIAAGYSWCAAQNKCLRPWEEPCTPQKNFPADAYPLYSGIAWGAEEAATETVFLNGTSTTLTGYRVTSETIDNITDIGAVSTPFETYYRQKLQAAGWTRDTMLEAGGPGSSISGYTKGGDYIIISYATVFHAGGTNEPVQCPCDTTLSIFYGTE